jgi:hypothetical protein
MRCTLPIIYKCFKWMCKNSHWIWNLITKHTHMDLGFVDICCLYYLSIAFILFTFYSLCSILRSQHAIHNHCDLEFDTHLLLLVICCLYAWKTFHHLCIGFLRSLHSMLSLWIWNSWWCCSLNTILFIFLDYMPKRFMAAYAEVFFVIKICTLITKTSPK